MKVLSSFPVKPHLRDPWIVEQRGVRNQVDPSIPYAYFVEEERLHNREIASIATIFLTNRECPWRCTMCDLWKNTTLDKVPPGSIPKQIEYALSRLPATRQIKLYNSGSFFDPSAIPLVDYPAIASMVRHFERVIVESHPALIQQNCFTFRQLVGTKLEVAMGLETVHPAVLEKLNKRMTLGQYQNAAAKLRANDIDLRSFILLQPPFMASGESFHWACRSIDFAVACHATAIALIPTRAGNGAMDSLAHSGAFEPPTLSLIEDAQDYGLSLAVSRIGVDMWEIGQIASAQCCHQQRLERIQEMNLSQQLQTRIECSHTHE